MVTSTVSIIAFAIFNVCTSAVEKRLLQAEDGFSGSPTLSPTEAPTFDCGLELPYRRMMPMCQLMHGDRKSCQGAYVQYAIRGETESRKWAEPCIYFQENGSCLPFPPCMKEETWIPLDLKRNSTASSTPAPSTTATESPSMSPSMSPSLAPSTLPTLSPTSIPTFSPTTIPTTSPTTIPTTSPTTIPTTSPTGVPTTLAPTSAQIDCAGKKKGKCRKTEGCRYVNKNKGCRIRIKPCSFFGKKSQCRNSQGCMWQRGASSNPESCISDSANQE